MKDLKVNYANIMEKVAKRMYQKRSDIQRSLKEGLTLVPKDFVKDLVSAFPP